MSFVQPWMLYALPLAALPIIIHLINQWRYQTKRWGAMMFLLQANRMARGYAKLRQWLILAMRTLAILGLIIAVARPLASGLLGWTGGGKADTTILLLDRSPSMQQTGVSGQSKLDTGKRQLTGALETLGSSTWVLIDSTDGKPQSFSSLKSLVDSPETRGAGNTADIPGMLQETVEYLKNNRPGATEVWICSDLRSADWNADSANWSAVRDAFTSLPQSVRFHLLAYPEANPSNLSVRVRDVRRRNGLDGNSLLMTIQISRAADQTTPVTVPVQIEIDGARTELSVELNGGQVELRDHQVSLAGNQQRGWGRVSIPSDANPADNSFYFVFDDPPQRRIVVVSDDRDETVAVELAASISPDGKSDANVEFFTPDVVDSLILDDAALLIWQTALPQGDVAGMIQRYVGDGGQVLFYPPAGIESGIGIGGEFLGASWGDWVNADQQVMVENWRGDQDLLAATRSGAGLPLGQLEINGYAKIEGELTQLATVTGGDPLLARVATAKGGVYLCAASPSNKRSSLATNGIVLYASIQRAIDRGLAALGQTSQQVAGGVDAVAAEMASQWRQVSGEDETLSSEYGFQPGVYEIEEGDGSRLLAVNRSGKEDQRDKIEDSQLNALFDGLDFSRVDDAAGSLSGIVREVWRIFLLLMIAAMLIEATLCIPRKASRAKEEPSRFAASTKQRELA